MKNEREKKLKVRSDKLHFADGQIIPNRHSNQRPLTVRSNQ